MRKRMERLFLIIFLAVMLSACILVRDESQEEPEPINALFYDEFSGPDFNSDWGTIRSHNQTPDAKWPVTFGEIDGRSVVAVQIEQGVDVRGEFWTIPVEAKADVVFVELTYMVQHDLDENFVPHRFDLLIMPGTEWKPTVETKAVSWFSGLDPDVWYKLRFRVDAVEKTVNLWIVEEEGSFEEPLFARTVTFNTNHDLDTWEQVSVRFLVSDRNPAESGTIYFDNIGIYLEEHLTSTGESE